jgi:hypothetical protein
MLRLTLAALLVAGAVGLGGCATYDGYGYAGGYYGGYDYPAYGYNPVIVPAPYPYTYQRHIYHPDWRQHEWERRGWTRGSLRNPAWPRGNYGPGHGAYHGPRHGGAIAGDR